MKGCWVVKFKSGEILIFSEMAYSILVFQHNRKNAVSEIHQHWFDEVKAREKYPDGIVLRVKGL